MRSTADIVIIGGGVMGVSTAYHLAVRGAGRVVLLERERLFGSGATGRCAGGVRYQFSTELNIRLSLASLPMLERFPDEIGQEIDYRRCGYLFYLTNEADVATFQRSTELQQRLGLDTEWLDGDEVRRRLPMMRLDDVLAGTFGPRDGLADPGGVVQGYIARAQALGVEAHNDVAVTGITVCGDRVSAVETSQGSIETATVINAAGPWAAQVGALAGLERPIVPIRRQLIVTGALHDIPEDFPFVIDFARSLYFHREGPGIITGMSRPDEAPGLDDSVDPDWEAIQIEASLERLPALEDAHISARWAGLYEVTPDAHPILGPTPIEGLFVVGGFSGHGFMHGPIAGKLMTEILFDGRATSVDVSALDLARFAEGREITEHNVV